MKKRGIFFKVFTYTAIFLLIVVCVTIALFSQQFLAFYNTNQRQQLYTSYSALHEQLIGRNEEDLTRIAGEFSDFNRSFVFSIRDSMGNVVFFTPGMDVGDENFGGHRAIMSLGTEHTLFAVNQTADRANYAGLIQRSLFAIAGMLAVALLGAYIFARQMTNPIKRLANDTKKMTLLEDVATLPRRHDEIGSLTHDVHLMYKKLRETIEAQQYFFSAASHELKTPIAATSVLLEGMLENIGDYKNHPKYLRECLKMMDHQNKTISEILELVNLNDGKIVLHQEKLNLHEIIISVLPNYQMLADANGQSIIMEIPEELVGFADEDMLKKVLSNVILNAVQNTEAGGEIRLWSETSASRHRICVLNTGAFIAGQDIAKLFDPFYRVDKVRNQKDGRNGLGLTIVRKTLEAMGADFGLVQTEQGVLFWFDVCRA